MATPNFILAGLGNPGEKYLRTRHNLGFRLVDAFYESSLVADRTPWQERRVGSATLLQSTAKLGSLNVTLLKPMTFMNLSGLAVAPVAKFYKLPTANILIAHDEVDFPFGRLKFKLGGGSGGHNGLKSVEQELGTNGFTRLRLGIGRPATLAGQAPAGSAIKASEIEIRDWVLRPFSSEEERNMEQFLNRAIQGVSVLWKEGLEVAMRQFN